MVKLGWDGWDGMGCVACHLLRVACDEGGCGEQTSCGMSCSACHCFAWPEHQLAKSFVEQVVVETAGNCGVFCTSCEFFLFCVCVCVCVFRNNHCGGMICWRSLNVPKSGARVSLADTRLQEP